MFGKGCDCARSSGGLATFIIVHIAIAAPCAPAPVELGGLGVSSVHDLVVASSRLARGDASVAIGVNMHLVAVMALERRRAMAAAAGTARREAAFGASLTGSRTTGW